ncbi:unnamed protein product [Sympodiomycopsis kandeliae]
MASTSVAHLKPEDVLPSLTAHNASFMTLLDLIPPNYYLSPQDDLDDDEDDQAGLNTKYMKNKRKAKQEAQLAKSSEKKEKKRAKLDPANLKTVSQVQNEREKEKSAREAAAAGGDDSDAELDLEFEQADADDDDDDEDDVDATIGNDDDDEAAETTLNGSSSAPVRSQHDSITTLRQRLQNKIASMQNRRRIPDASSATGANMIDIDDSRDTSLDGEDSGDGDSSVASTRDELLEERRKRRGEVRDNRRRARKEMRRQALANANSNDPSKNAKGGAKTNGAQQGSRGSGGAIGQTQAPGLLVNESKSNGKSRDYGISSSAPTDLNFSSFQMPGDEKKKRDKNALPSNPKQALAMLEARKAKAAESGVPENDGDDSTRWSKALSAAKGVKIRDDEALLKRSVKRIEKQKQKSSIEWKDRKQEVKDKEAEKQKKRTENLKARKDAKMAKKKGGAKGGGKKTKDRKLGASKSGSSKGASGGRAGFEGKKMGKGLKMGARKGGSSSSNKK